mmetsp:Transcript_35627/g.40464  ORF Transcript_35627/g.40464 Transcript_35627/m.40464 type:complete len:420 (+) Transcript_35627:208-1467(+)
MSGTDQKVKLKAVAISDDEDDDYLPQPSQSSTTNQVDEPKKEENGSSSPAEEKTKGDDDDNDDAEKSSDAAVKTEDKDENNSEKEGEDTGKSFINSVAEAVKKESSSSTSASRSKTESKESKRTTSTDTSKVKKPTDKVPIKKVRPGSANGKKASITKKSTPLKKKRPQPESSESDYSSDSSGSSGSSSSGSSSSGSDSDSDSSSSSSSDSEYERRASKKRKISSSKSKTTAKTSKKLAVPKKKSSARTPSPSKKISGKSIVARTSGKKTTVSKTDALSELVNELLCRWWYAFPEWPPADYPWEEKLKENKLVLVKPTEWKFVPDVDDNGFTKVFSRDGYSGIFADPQGNNVDLRPKESCPSHNNLLNMGKEKVLENLVKAYENQIKQLTEGNYYDKKLETELKKSLIKYQKLYDRVKK